MIKKKFKAKKGCWHARLMKFIWGWEPTDFRWVCKYFWLSIINVLLIVVQFVSVKWFLKVIIGRYVWPVIRQFIRWSYIRINRWHLQAQSKLDQWAVEAQDRWEARRLRDLQEMDKNNPFIKKALAKRAWDLEHSLGKFAYSDNITATERRFFIFLMKVRNQHAEDWNRLLKTKAEVDRGIVESAAEKIKRLEQERAKNLAYDVAVEELAESKRHAENLRYRENMKKKALQEERDHQRALRKAQRADRQLQINKVLRIIKPIARGFIWVVGTAVILIATFALYKLVKVITKALGNVPHKDYVQLGHTLKMVLLGVGIAAVLGAFILLLYYLLKSIKIPRVVISKPKVRVKIKINFSWLHSIGKFLLKCLVTFKFFLWPFIKAWRALVWIGRGLVKFGRGVGTFFRMLIQTIKDDCPALEWED